MRLNFIFAAIDAAVKFLRESFGPHCSEKCLKAQLHKYYDKLCEGKLKPRGGKGTDIEEMPAPIDIGVKTK